MTENTEPTQWGLPLMRFFSNILGFVIPAYQTFRAIKSPNKDDDKQWLTYWVVFSLFSCIEFVIGPAFIKRIPFYWELKTIFILWLQVARGALIIYDQIVEPFFVEYEEDIDRNLEKIKTKAQEGANSIVEKVSEKVGDIARKSIHKGLVKENEKQNLKKQKPNKATNNKKKLN
mmetsp:Transcript_6835/g.9981  ORF Transcript_6835/g.9981 Transcript_6835/m.9981 type:complete len:174 (+) Transcript_6835:43-564(+)